MMTRRIDIGGKTLELVQGDITGQDTDAIVNAANSGLRGGGGVDGAIHRAGGPAIMAECRRLGGCPTGSAVITGAGELKARYVIHAVGPVFGRAGGREAEMLAGAIRRSLELAGEHGLRSVALPAVSTGIYGYPVDKAAQVMLSVAAQLLEGETSLELVRFVLFDADTLGAFERALGQLFSR